VNFAFYRFYYQAGVLDKTDFKDVLAKRIPEQDMVIPADNVQAGFGGGKVLCGNPKGHG
jgi:hypothetical protein